MSYVKLFFGKSDITELTYSDIGNYFKTEKEESDKIEFKSFETHEKDKGGIDAKERGVLRSIDAFLNSEGGILIWGAPKGQKIEGKNEKIFKGQLALVEAKYEKDEFVAKITNRITPSPKGIRFHSIEKGGKYIYIFEIPKSEYSPHQFDHAYYMRLDGQTVHAPHHYIEALFKKISFPNIEGYLKIEAHSVIHDKFNLTTQCFFFNQSKFQNDYTLSCNLKCPEGIFSGWPTQVPTEGITFGYSGHEIRRYNIKDVFHSAEPVSVYDTIVFNYDKLHQANFEVSILLSFGAKLSPIKFCFYKLKIDPQILSVDKNKCFLEIRENTLTNEIKDELQLTDEEYIRKIIGR
ncbi:MAG: ATP-binding protein [Bacteroidota bacterium]